MTTDQRIARRKLSLLELAQVQPRSGRTGNVSKAATQLSSKAQASANEAWDKLEQIGRAHV